ncbi:hypothetical protein M231_08097 [Tremella mesenterica]|uniref:Amino acid transporter transmembrane domain-containing protein n=1 Tax=Tremella mesenterica TaxID=5217 RepID=A0A4Q1BAJ3_TREME|nr:hypothetical protein M231_08097 [Tremella mesenterica]
MVITADLTSQTTSHTGLSPLSLSTQATEITPLISQSNDLAQHANTSSSFSNHLENGREQETVKEVEVFVPGESTFIQTLLNILCNIIGTGLLACPIALAHAGWILGPILMAMVAATTLYTLKIFLRIIEKNKSLKTYTEVVGQGLGPIGLKLVTVIFVMETMTWIVTLVVLYSDTLAAVWPILRSDQWKWVSLVVIIPTSFMPLRYLSFTSGFGITTNWVLIGILLFTGIVTDGQHSPGSLHEPAHTDLWPNHGLIKFGTVIGILLSGYGGHALIPNLIRDMKEHLKADRVCELAYGIAISIYLLVAVCGYIMNCYTT